MKKREDWAIIEDDSIICTKIEGLHIYDEDEANSINDDWYDGKHKVIPVTIIEGHGIQEGE